MHGIGLAFLACWVSVGAGQAAEPPSPRQVIERAIEVRGGQEVMRRKVALHFRMKGKIHLPGGIAGPATLQVDLYRSPGLGEKTVATGNVLGTAIQTTVVRKGERAWQSQNGTVTEMSADELKGNQQSSYLDRMSRLTNLLEDKAFTLTALPEAGVEGRPAHVIQVKRKDHPDVRLFFDKESGFLVKGSYTSTAGSNKGKEQAIVFGDFRDPGDPARDEKALKAAGVSPEPKALFGYLRERMSDAKAAAKAATLTGQLGSDSFAEREQAQKGLLALGKAAQPALEKAAGSSDAEVARRARALLKRIEVRDQGATVRAAVRVLARHETTGTARALLDLMPGADEATAEEVHAALAYLAERKGPEARALEAALDDKDAIKKAAAEGALGKDGGKSLAQPGRRLYLAGFKYPMKQTYYLAGEKVLDGRIVQIDYYNALDEKVFAKPK